MIIASSAINTTPPAMNGLHNFFDQVLDTGETFEVNSNLKITRQTKFIKYKDRDIHPFQGTICIIMLFIIIGKEYAAKNDSRGNIHKVK
jgi:hypothetical protein